MIESFGQLATLPAVELLLLLLLLLRGVWKSDRGKYRRDASHGEGIS
jgi:hypothetical protein